MAAANIIGTFCKANAGVHASVTLTVAGVVQGTYPMILDDIVADVTEDEKVIFTRLLIKIRKIGKTNAQLKSDIIAGFTVTV